MTVEPGNDSLERLGHLCRQAPAERLSQRDPLEPVMLDVTEHHLGVWTNLDLEDRPVGGSVGQRPGKDGQASLLQEFALRAGFDRLTREASPAGWSPGPITFIVGAAVRSVQQKKFATRLAGPVHDDRCAERRVCGSRSAIRGCEILASHGSKSPALHALVGYSSASDAVGAVRHSGSQLRPFGRLTV